ncbi:ribonuclease-3 family protein [Catenibacillus scindens]|uniref:Mini-ribonuclease 3 n=2 Tax=Catenibacillus scindens TaxID=673271 RepID=A0A7W8HBJ1_9FIRM|nr:ribonuclease-3 family protein [Catenibacillus scindens]
MEESVIMESLEENMITESEKNICEKKADEKPMMALDEHFRAMFGLKVPDVRAFSPLTLAYLGDAVFEIIVRTIVVEHSNAPVNKLHKRSSALVKASSQAEMVKVLEPLLTQEEEAVYKRGRNAKSYTMAKNATMTDYRMATGFEALLGYLYLKQDLNRIIELVHYGLNERIQL